MSRSSLLAQGIHADSGKQNNLARGMKESQHIAQMLEAAKARYHTLMEECAKLRKALDLLEQERQRLVGDERHDYDGIYGGEIGKLQRELDLASHREYHATLPKVRVWWWGGRLTDFALVRLTKKRIYLQMHSLDPVCKFSRATGLCTHNDMRIHEDDLKTLQRVSGVEGGGNG